MTDTILTEIATAQAAPADDYMVWAEIGSGSPPQRLILHSARLPQSLDLEGVTFRIKSHAAKTLSELGCSDEEIDGAKLHIDRLPSAEEVEAELNHRLSAGDELVLADLTFWEACRLRLHLTPNQIEGGDIEMDYKGLKVRRSAVS